MPVSLWLDGCFDGFHYAHANVIRQALYLTPSTPENSHSLPRIVVGIHSDQEILKHKGPPIFEESERYALIRGCRWVDKVVEDVPYVTVMNITQEQNIDFVVHGDDPVYDANGQDCYGIYKTAGKYLECKRTKGISTTSLIQRLLSPESRVNENEEHLNLLVDQFAKSVPYSFPVIRYEELKTQADFDAVRKLWNSDKRVAYVGGDWDCFGSGHVEYLRRCKKLLGAENTILVIGVWSDDELEKSIGEKPLLSLLERTLAIIQCKYADAVIISAPPILPERAETSLGLDSFINVKAISDERRIIHVDIPPMQSIKSVRKRLLSQKGLFEERQRRKEQSLISDLHH